MRLLSIGGALALAGPASGETGKCITDDLRFQTIALDPVAPETLYVGGAAGVFRSDDSGETWRPADAGLINREVRALAIDPSAPRTLYAATEAGVFKTTDGAGSWAATGLTGASVSDLVIDSRTPGTLFAATFAEVSKTVDGGESWRSLSGYFGSPEDLAIDPTDSRVLYAVAHVTRLGSYVFRTSDGGQTWQLRSDGFGDPRFGFVVTRIAIDPVSPETLYLGTSRGMYKSSNGGLTWGGSSQGLGGCLPPPSPPICTTPTAVAVDPGNPDKVFAGTYGGLYVSTDRSRTWTLHNEGLGASVVDAIASDNRGILYAATNTGLFRSVNAGANWTKTTGGLQLCLLGRRFSVRLSGIDPRTGNAAGGAASQRNDLFGYFGFPSLTGQRENPEVFVKVLNGTVINGKFWVFWGGLTDLEYTVSVTDTATGLFRVYRKEAGSACGGFDVDAFPGNAAAELEAEAEPAAAPATDCPFGGEELCLQGGRFRLRLGARDPRTGRRSGGLAIPENGLFGYFTLPGLTGDANNPEVFAKVLDGSIINGHFWVFFGGLTDLEYTLGVTDTKTGQSRVYFKEAGSPCGGLDTSAF